MTTDLIYRVREDGKDGGAQFMNLETAATAAYEWYEETGKRCHIECKHPDGEWMQSTLVAWYLAPPDQTALQVF